MSAPSPSVWVIADRSGWQFDAGSRADWLAEWRRRVAEIERADRPVPARRASLETTLVANADAFQALAKHGAMDAALEVTGMIAAADGRLSRMDTKMEFAA
ncbi:hypothetical protein [Paracraurococcus lichenis]|uniref:Uncharacterized protein n=1 Tax=Paracraurococcus lichenis TaxID=3064888 RepID=A0ABT9E882_9PROT|nr:hypothetical protein [Paracraurococcus sp. LOR1-02]MDO9712383.1 hypothetical protein [Paracraurococcus sp. LOR1-02]